MILAFDTSGAHCAACVMDADGTAVIAQAYEPMTKGQAERLFPMIIEMLAGADLTLQQITRIGVGVGPGNFTGIRISVAAARGLALSLDIPAIGVSSFETLVIGRDRPCYAVVETHQDMVYWQGFGTADTQPHMGARNEVPTDAQQHDRETLLPYPIAESIARIAAARVPAEPPKPLYVRAPDAAPPRDKPPVILD